VIEELAGWCLLHGITRPLVLGGRPIAEIDILLPLIHALEARGLSVRPCDRARSADTLAVGEAVAAYHLDDCDGVIALGGAVAMEVAKATVLMVGQHRPFVDFIEDGGADPEAEPWLTASEQEMPRWIAVPTTPLAAAYCGGATVLADDMSRACCVRHPGLRPERVIVDASLSTAIDEDVWRQSLRAAYHVMIDAGASAGAAEITAEMDIEDLLVHLAARGAGPIEAHVGVLRRLAVSVAARKGARLSAGLVAAAQETSGGLAGLGVREGEIEELVSSLPGTDPERVREMLRSASLAPGGPAAAPTGRRRGGREGRRQRGVEGSGIVD
jgi:hypothetical protein